jgi:hypothetical protein
LYEPVENVCRFAHFAMQIGLVLAGKIEQSAGARFQNSISERHFKTAVQPVKTQEPSQACGLIPHQEASCREKKF